MVRRIKKLIGSLSVKRNLMTAVPALFKNEEEISFKSSRLFFNSASEREAKAIFVFSKRPFITTKLPCKGSDNLLGDLRFLLQVEEKPNGVSSDLIQPCHLFQMLWLHQKVVVLLQHHLVCRLSLIHI